MGGKALILVGTKKGVFILEDAADRKSWRTRGPYCEHWPINHVVARSRNVDDLRRGRQRMVRTRDLDVDRSRRELDAFEQGTGVQRGRDADEDGLERRRRARPRLRRRRARGAFRQRRSWRELAAYRRAASASFAAAMDARRRGLICTPSSCIPKIRSKSGLAFRRSGCFTPRTAGRLGRRAIQALAATICPRACDIPSLDSACIASRWRRGNPTGFISKTIAASIAATTAARRGKASRKVCRPSFGFPVAVHPRDPDRLFFMPLNGAEQGRYPPDAKAAVWRSDDCGRDLETQGAMACRNRAPISA